jgi:multidrug efflux pump
MIISDTAIKNRISVLVLAVIILIIGTYCYRILPRESDPDITIPNVFVSTNYKGVSASDIETSITIKIEKKLKGLDRVKKIHSVSSEGLSSINIEFLPETDIDEVLQKVKDKVDEAKKDLPGDLEDDPAVFEVNFSELPIVVFSISGDCGNTCLKDIADDLKEDIESITGILEVEVTGGLEREIRIEVDPDKLAYYRIPITQFQGVVNSENQNTSGGSITLGHGRYQLRVTGEFETPEEVLNLVVSTDQERPIYLKDLAKVVDGFKDETTRSRLNGREAVNISVKKRIGENIIEIADKIDQLIDTHRHAWPRGTEITKLMNRAKEIRSMVADLENNILSGLVLVIIVLFFALGFRNAILVSLAIPFSMLLTFIVLHIMGITLNVVVLFSLTLALGMVVDNAIVIIENVYRYMEQGVPRIQAAMKGTSEVAYPVIGSTLTTLAAFAPLIFWPGIMGGFMKYLPITLIITLCSSLFTAMLINPALAAIFVKIKDKHSSASGQKLTAQQVANAGETPVAIKGIILPIYAGFMKHALKHRISVLCISFAFLILFFEIWFLKIGIERPIELFPQTDPNSAYINIEPPQGSDIDYIDKIVRKVEMAITGKQGDPLSLDFYEPYYKLTQHQKADGQVFPGPGHFDNIEHIYAQVVENFSSGRIFGSTRPNHLGIQFLDLEDRKRPSADTIEDIRTRISNIPGAELTIALAEGGPPTGAPINIEISGDDFHQLGKIAKQIKKVIAKVQFVDDIQDNYVEAIPSVQVRIDRQKAALFGLSTNVIGLALKTAYNGMEISTYHEDDEDFDITVTLGREDRQVTDVLHKLMLPTPTGQLVPLTTLAQITYSGSLGDIVRINHNRVVTVKATVDETQIPGPVARLQAEQLLKNFVLPAGYKIKFTGEFEFQKESEEFLSQAFIIAIFLIFLILVTLFNSVTQPLMILTSVILSFGGAFLGLFILNSPFGIIMTGVGIISLAGVVVNNAIVLIDYTNKLKQRGMETIDAIISAGATRLRPVILTAVTTILGLLPMVTGISYDFHKMEISLVSESSQWWQSMAIVVIFGLMIATFLTLVVVPALYSLLLSMREASKSSVKKIKNIYWKPYEWLVSD